MNMAYNQNGQAYSGAYGRYYQQQNNQGNQQQQQQQQQQQHQYDAQPVQPLRPPQRRPSYETGDDRPYGDGRIDERRPSAGGSHVRMPDYSQYVGGGADNRYASASYQGHGSPDPQANQYTPAAYNPQQYNPQQYVQPTAQYSNPSYSTPPMNSSPAIPFQPYVPAAYSSTTSPVAGPGYPGYSPSNYFSPTFQGTRPSAQMPYETEYGQRPSVSSISSNSPYQNQQSYSSYSVSPPVNTVGSPVATHTSVYTPPAPPPPPTASASEHYSSTPGTSAIYDNQYASQPASTRPAISQPVHHSRDDSGHSQGRNDYYSSGDYVIPTAGSYLPNVAEPRHRRGGVAAQGVPQRQNTGGRHPQSRPLPGPPQGSEGQGSSASGVDDLLSEIEAAVMERAPTNARRETSPQRREYDQTYSQGHPQPLRVQTSPRHQHQQSNGVDSGINVNYNAYSDDSDAEAAAGLAAMRLAEEQDAADHARRSEGGMSAHTLYGSRPNNNPLPVPPKDGQSGSDSDAFPDMDHLGGVSGNYGYTANQQIQATQPRLDTLSVHRNTSTGTGRSDFSSDTLITPSGGYYGGEDTNLHPFPAFGASARTDTGGTGGLSEPGHRRMSFEDGDEETLTDYLDQSSGATSPTKDSIRSRSSHQHSRTNSRPLPQLPRRGAVDQSNTRQTDQYGRPMYPQAPDEYENTTLSSSIQKANSVGSHSQTPTVVPPGRSVTDAEQRRKSQLMGGRQPVYGDQLSPDTANHSKYADMVLPTIPAGKRRKFVPSKLSTSDYKKCQEPWAESSILIWLKEMTEGESDLKEQAIVDGIVALFTHKVPTMNMADAEVLGARLVEEMFERGALLREEEWVKFGTNPMSGVIYQLTGTGCYSSRVHTTTMVGRCYSHHCMRTLKKVNLKTQELAPQRKLEDWATFYHLKKEDIVNASKKEVERQNNLHEIVTTEDTYMDQLDVLRILYRDGLANSADILSAKKRERFITEVFGKVDAVKQANEDFLLAQLKYRQGEQGPWVKGFSDIFREWIRKAKTPYIEYAANFPKASLKVRKEAERNVLFKQFLDQVRDNERSKRLGWDTFLKAPITRLQRYGLLLQTVYKHTEGEGQEKKNLEKAMDEIKLVTLECDNRVAEMSKRTELEDLQGKLELRSGMEKVQLNLTHLGRELIYRGDLQRKGANKVSWVDTHAILFDHYMVLSKRKQNHDAAGGLKHEAFDVSKLPIPMDLLVLESTNDDPVVKSSVKGIASVSAVSRTERPSDRLARVGTSQTNTSGNRPGVMQFNTETSTISSGSSKTLVANTILDGQSDKTLYPFRVKHLGKLETYVLYAPSLQNRSEWCDKIIDAKTRHAASLFAQNAEPFRLRVVADTAFNYPDSSGANGPGVVIKGTPLDRAIEECDRSFYGTSQAKQGHICRSAVNCATTFQPPVGKRMCAIGTDNGVFVAEYDNPRAWAKVHAIVTSHVTQIAVLEEFSVFLVIADKALVAYHLDTVCPPGGVASSDSKKAPQKLSGNRDVGFFATGRMKDRTLVFYKKREVSSSTFKVLEPVYQKSSTSSRSRFGFRKGTTDFFRDFDEFYIPGETYGINLFHTSLAVGSTRGIEVLTLDKKVTFSIPDLKQPHTASIAQRIEGQKPLGMFRLNDNEFLLVFEEVGIYVDKHGDVSRAVVMEFVGRARQAALYNHMYLILIDSSGGFVEVRNAINGRLRQVVSGRDVRLLDDGMSGGGTVKICLQHPEKERVQLVVEMIVNEGLKE